MDANGKSIALAALRNDTLRNAAVGVVLAVGVVAVAATQVWGFLSPGRSPIAPWNCTRRRSRTRSAC